MTTIIDYHAGNLTSVLLAFKTIGSDAVVSSDPAAIRAADRILFPGVGAAGTAMENLRSLGLADAIRERVAAGVPFLGICLGTQILLESSEEDGGVQTLGIVKGACRKFVKQTERDKIPEIGWNQISIRRGHAIFEGIPDSTDFYFVHSYYPAPSSAGDVLCETTYCGTCFASAIGHGNVVATQFHPEKSGKFGLRLLSNFVKWNP